MNYRHIYHAGNFADVLKHAVLARLIDYLKLKDKPFRVIDTHAGIGLYDLSSEEAQKTGEWHDGIGKLFGKPLPAAIAPLLSSYFETIAVLNPDGRIRHYPGSPKIARLLLRKQDRLSLMELHPADAETLKANFADDFQTRVTELDGWLAMNAHVPPKEKRGIILVDPPFELDGEYKRLVDGLGKAWRKFPGGIYCLWYPLKQGAPIKYFLKDLHDLEIPKMLRLELSVKSDRDTTGLSGSGLIVVNPPYTLKGEMDVLLPFLRTVLAQDQAASFVSEWIRPEA
jgi:23S rRNA (adenine2030-N6)-methyltransferase